MPAHVQALVEDALDAPLAAEQIGLDRVLRSMVERLQPTTTAKLLFKARPDAGARLSTMQVVQMTQLARTALANCLRHANARQIEISLSEKGGVARLEIADDGAGFDPNRTSNGGMGLTTMRSRATEAGGTLEVHSRPGHGTRIVVELPSSESGLPREAGPTS